MRAVLAVDAVMAVVLVVWLYRNQWVYRARIDILHADSEAYRTLPTYGVMITRFWVWDAARFVGWVPDQQVVEQVARVRAAARGRKILQRRNDKKATLGPRR